MGFLKKRLESCYYATALFLVRLHLEYPVQFCSSDARKDIFELGKVQEKVTRMIKGVDQLPHQESLNRIDWK